MRLSKAARRGIVIFSRLQTRTRQYLVPKLEPQEKAMKVNERFDKEREQRERRAKR